MNDNPIKSFLSRLSLPINNALNDLEAQAVNQHNNILEEGNAKILEKQNELQNIINKMRHKYQLIRQQHNQLGFQKTNDLEESLEKARKEQQYNQNIQEKNLANQRSKLDMLRQQAEERIKEMPLEKQEIMSKRLDELINLAIQKQKELEEQQHKNLINDQAKLSRLTRQAQENLQKTQQEHIANMKRDLDQLVKVAANKEREIQEEFKNLSKNGQKEIYNLLNSARNKQDKIREKYKNILQENKLFMKNQISLSQAYIKKGNTEEVVRIQKAMIESIHKHQEEMQSEHNALSLSARQEIIDLTEFNETSQRNIIKRQEMLIKQAKTLMDNQAENHMKRIQHVLVIQTREDIEKIKIQMLANRENLQAEQLEMIKQVAINIEKQAEDNIRRKDREQKEIIANTKRNILKLEERSQADQRRIEKENHEMIDNAKRDLLEIDRQSSISQRNFASEQKEVMKKTLMEAKDFSYKNSKNSKKEEWDRIQLGREKCRQDIGKESYENIRRVEQEKRVASMQAKMEMVSIGKKAHETKEQLQKERDNLTRMEIKELIALKQNVSDRQKELEKEHLKRIRKEQFILDDAIKNNNLSRQHIEEEMKEIEELIHSNESHQEASPISDEEHQELTRLINLAKIKHKEIVEDQEIIIENINISMQQKIETSQRILKEEQKELLKTHQKELDNITKKTEEKKKSLKQEQETFFRQHDENMKSIMNNAEDEQLAIRNEHMKIISDAQNKLTGRNKTE